MPSNHIARALPCKMPYRLTPEEEAERREEYRQHYEEKKDGRNAG